MILPASSVRGRIRRFVEKHADELGTDVLEVGSRMEHPWNWWINNRDLARGKWTGADLQIGHNVDVVADLHRLPQDWTHKFTGALCSEVLEHVARPWIALPELHRVIQPGGLVIVTTLFAFPEHGYPDDFYRYTTSGLALLLRDAGFSQVETEYSRAAIEVELDDHGEGSVNRREIPMHVFAVARA